VIAVGCRPPQNEVVVYTALDREFSEPIFEEFTKRTGIVVRAKYDSEASKTVGLVNLILNERQRPRCDLFWNNEILNTIRLEKAGLLEAYESPSAADYPATYRSPESRWHGFAARARVLLVNTDLVSEEDRPTSIEDLLDPRWKGEVGVAKPLFGTTASHAACLFHRRGEEQGKEFFRQLKKNAKVLAGNRQVSMAVANGQLHFGLTDTDDAIIQVEKGMPVAIVYPDQAADGAGTLFIPNTLGLISGGPNPESARRLVDFLLSPEIEKALAEGRSAQIPLNPSVQAEVRVATPSEKRPMEVDFGTAAEQWTATATFLQDLFTGAP
jgi:iron(III) transport system substrate-binding protein